MDNNNNKGVVVHHNLPREMGGKQKVGQAVGKNRRVLGDIGNLVTAPAVEGKPKMQITRPATRSFCAQLLANAQAEKNKKSLAEVVNKGGQIKVPAKKKASDNLANETVIVISPDKEEVKTIEESPLSRRKTKKTGKTLTSTLTARSKAACGLSNRPKNEIDDIDAADADNHLAAVEYVEDIYNFYKLTEDEGRVNDYMNFQPELNHKMRAILVDWLIEVHRKFELMPESLYLAINILDRFLSVKTVPRRELQLVGISSMLIACKYEEIWAPEVNDFIHISDNAYARESILQMEKAILGKLEWYLTVPTPYVFLVRYIKASTPNDQEMENMAFFFAELGLMNYQTTIACCPSMLAASSVYGARSTLNKSPLWTQTLQHHTGYSEEQLMECTKQLVGYHLGAAENKLKAIYRKFSSPDRGAVALFPPARNLSPTTTTTTSSC
ncbi:G2/mitotic-specific cyclin S13-7-like isoform X2 [Lycium ferocissimum]|uniref:G2/mitotic-specific cyclin S13-7-like isoform X2 n=1 Tax=Lycium ferocissimum TaxID=112874 RepID=UPI002814AAA8|nr:G2/mitotic-specific cyclin S13-7-like isoform X2 [Lycium ferocissimum]